MWTRNKNFTIGVGIISCNIRSVIQRLSLYFRDSGNDTFQSFKDGKLYEVWESSTLAIVRSYSSFDGLACFVGLLTSEIGHRLDLFDSHGWDMLQRIFAENSLRGYLFTCYELFFTLSGRSNPAILTSSRCMKIFSQFWSGDVAGQLPQILLFMKQTVSNSVSTLAETLYVVNFWCALVFSSPNWTTSNLQLQVLDELCRLTYRTQHSFELLSVFSIEYRKLIFSFGPSEGEQSWKLLSPVKKLYYTAKERMYENSALAKEFPTFIRLANYIGKPTLYAANCHYFLLIAASVEMFAERDIRQEIGAKLVRMHTDTEHLQEITAEKPISQLSIYKFLDILLELPLDHPTMPIMCQVYEVR